MAVVKILRDKMWSRTTERLSGAELKNRHGLVLGSVSICKVYFLDDAITQFTIRFSLSYHPLIKHVSTFSFLISFASFTPIKPSSTTELLKSLHFLSYTDLTLNKKVGVNGKAS